MAAEAAHALVANRLPLTARAAQALGLVDEAFGTSLPEFEAGVRARALALATATDFNAVLAAANTRRKADEARRPLAAYREDELARMKLNFFGFDPSYHVARYHFVAKVPRSRTPLHLALHRQPSSRGGKACARPGVSASASVPAVMHDA